MKSEIKRNERLKEVMDLVYKIQTTTKYNVIFNYYSHVESVALMFYEGIYKDETSCIDLGKFGWHDSCNTLARGYVKEVPMTIITILSNSLTEF